MGPSLPERLIEESGRTFLSHKSDRVPFSFKTLERLRSIFPQDAASASRLACRPSVRHRSVCAPPSRRQPCPRGSLPPTCLCRCLDVLASPTMSQGATSVSRNRMGRPATPWLASCIQNKQSGVGARVRWGRAFQDNQDGVQRKACLSLGSKNDEHRIGAFAAHDGSGDITATR